MRSNMEEIHVSEKVVEPFIRVASHGSYEVVALETISNQLYQMSKMLAFAINMMIDDHNQRTSTKCECK